MIKQFIEDRPWVWIVLHPITAFKLWRLSKRMTAWLQEHSHMLPSAAEIHRIAAQVEEDIQADMRARGVRTTFDHERGIVTYHHDV